jgi:hypothetical protein
MFAWVIVSRQLHFHIYYLFVECNLINSRDWLASRPWPFLSGNFTHRRPVLCLVGSHGGTGQAYLTLGIPTESILEELLGVRDMVSYASESAYLPPN